MFAKLIKRAHQIRRNLGMRAAAGYLRNRDVAFEEAHFHLLGTMPRY